MSSRLAKGLHSELADRIRHEAAIADRPGQLTRLELIADEVDEALGKARREIEHLRELYRAAQVLNRDLCLGLERETRTAKADALEELADELAWVRPDECPCDNPEACCGSEESCDAMQPITRAIGEPTLRERAQRYREAS